VGRLFRVSEAASWWGGVDVTNDVHLGIIFSNKIPFLGSSKRNFPPKRNLELRSGVGKGVVNSFSPTFGLPLRAIFPVVCPHWGWPIRAILNSFEVHRIWAFVFSTGRPHSLRRIMSTSGSCTLLREKLYPYTISASVVTEIRTRGANSNERSHCRGTSYAGMITSNE
jgi:hypothetical protein